MGTMHDLDGGKTPGEAGAVYTGHMGQDRLPSGSRGKSCRTLFAGEMNIHFGFERGLDFIAIYVLLKT